MDCNRAFFSWKCMLSVFLVFLAFVFCGIDMYHTDVGIVDIMDSVFWGRMVMLTVPVCAFPFADSLCEDCEKKYYRLLYIRGNKRKYLFSKIIGCFFSACATMTIGFLLFCFILSCWFPVTVNGRDYTYCLMQSYGCLLQNKEYLFYFWLVGFQFGLLAGILSVVSMAFSTYISNRLLVFTAPLIVYYAIINIFAKVGMEKQYLQLHVIFKACHSKPWKNDVICFGWVLMVTLVCLMIAWKVAQWGMKRRCIND